MRYFLFSLLLLCSFLSSFLVFFGGHISAFEERDFEEAYQRIDDLVNKGLFSTGFVAELAVIQDQYQYDQHIFDYLSTVRHYAADILFAIGLDRFDQYLGHKYYLQGETVFYDRYPIEGADRATFEVLRDHYARDQYCVYFEMYCERDVRGRTGGDSQSQWSFLEDFYSQQGNRLFWRNNFVTTVDEGGVDYLGDSYIRVGQDIYFAGKALDVDAGSFQILGDGYSSDISGVYYFNDDAGVDHDSFVILGYNYAKDKKHVYFYNQKMKKIDADSVQVWSQHYVVDKDHVYFDNEVIAKADVASFQELSFPWAKDTRYVYEKGKIVAWLLPKRFEVIDSMQGLVADANGTYQYGKRISGSFLGRISNFALRVWSKIFYN